MGTIHVNPLAAGVVAHTKLHFLPVCDHRFTGALAVDSQIKSLSLRKVHPGERALYL